MSVSTETAVAATFVGTGAAVLFLIDQDPTVRMRSVARAIGITERAVQRLVGELEAGGYITIARTGRRNVYTVDRSRKLSHPLFGETTAGVLLAALKQPKGK